MLSHLGLIGNCQFSALVDHYGNIVWCCLPRFDSAPVFARLLDDTDGGYFGVGSAHGQAGTQRYIENTNVLETRFVDDDGAFRILDFAPRYWQNGRSFRPTMLVRMIEPLSGTPRISVRCQPRGGWTKTQPTLLLGSHHVEFIGLDGPARLTTNMPLAYVDGQPFALVQRIYLVFAWGEPLLGDIEEFCKSAYHQTVGYWQRWVKHCVIPPLFQDEVIRSALALKLHCFEDTGAIIAATTTSIPESPNSGRTWDYRYCWLRDAYYVLGAFRLLGHFEEREAFLQFVANVAASAPDLELAPLYRIDGRRDLDEFILPDWPGFLGHGPVRVGNQAATHRQIDVYGETVLTIIPVFFDQRYRDLKSPALLEMLTQLTRKAISLAGQPDAGIWEYREKWQPQTFSTLMSWAAADRMATVARTFDTTLANEFAGGAARLHAEILQRGVSSQHGTLVATYGGQEHDAALLQAVALRFLPNDHKILHQTVDAISRDLSRQGWLFRYRTLDDFGVPQHAFMICTFWLAEALAMLGRGDEARLLLAQLKAVKAPLGLLAEDLEPSTGQMWGNFPQAYSHVGLIHAAFAASPAWHQVL